ncbi:MAG: DUF4325 domain-containing protein [Fusobacteriaceae bacterium]|nr:DUF4325 domain-containing protein [Fusobacteriaceae bacterium]MBN2838966.1 DUF4325 domain-containing protein [Fusobacteriaceae bacterium]
MVVYMEDYIGRDPGFLYETISESIERGNRIVINFKGVDNVSMEYLKESVGRVLEENGFDTLKNKLNFVNVKNHVRYELVSLVKGFPN